MTKTIVNLALSVVVETAEKILVNYPDHPYQQAFSIPELRRKLVSYVLSRVSGHYVVVDDLEEPCIDAHCIYSSSEEHMQIEALIHQGIHHILQENSDWVDHHIPQDVNAGLAPSTWFG